MYNRHRVSVYFHVLYIPRFPNRNRSLQILFRIASYFSCFRFHREKFDVAVSVASSELVAVRAPIEGENLVVMYIHVGNRVRRTPLKSVQFLNGACTFFEAL